MMKTRIIAGIAVMALLFTGCQGTDVIAKYSVTSLDAVMKKLPSPVATDAASNGWSLVSPTGERFSWSKNFSLKDNPDLVLEFDIKPFLDAGLNPDKLNRETYSVDEKTNKLRVNAEIGSEAFGSASATAALDSFKELVKTHREIIKYHEELDHYGVAFGNGNMFEWAKDMTTNDKDIVFVLNPQPFIEAGAVPEKVAGWVFAKVEVMDDKGQKENVDKLLKPFDLK